ncbi:MAG TPA: acylphosphatase [Chitinophagaceae bacterium]|nr:acylphosphatase [Chitinophagaceae bacterium]HPH32091.1 acylphosphatase [Chitinophagaceae bacterium]HPN59269.1 acylphosphatase [Chitinophagaceae bacterium]
MVNELSSIRLIVKGKVQGVFFRKHTRQKALDLGLEGEVMNQPDGSVCVLATGTKDQLEALTAYCRTGPPAASVSSLQVEIIGFKKFSSFRILK